jgi:hypothetical protein
LLLAWTCALCLLFMFCSVCRLIKVMHSIHPRELLYERALGCGTRIWITVLCTCVGSRKTNQLKSVVTLTFDQMNGSYAKSTSNNDKSSHWKLLYIFSSCFCWSIWRSISHSNQSPQNLQAVRKQQGVPTEISIPLKKLHESKLLTNILYP